MLKERIIELIDRYEDGEEYLSEYDVMEELEDIMDDEPYVAENFAMEVALNEAIRQFIWERHEAERSGGHCMDGSDEFIEEIKRIVEYE